MARRTAEDFLRLHTRQLDADGTPHTIDALLRSIDEGDLREIPRAQPAAGRPPLTMEDLRAAWRTLTETSPKAARAVALYYHGGLTDREVAEAVGVSPGLANRRKQRGVAAWAAVCGCSERWLRFDLDTLHEERRVLRRYRARTGRPA